MSIEESERVRVTAMMSKDGRESLKELSRIFGCPQYEVVDALVRTIDPKDERFQDMIAERIDDMPFVIQRWYMMKNLSADPKFANFIRKGKKKEEVNAAAS